MLEFPVAIVCSQAKSIKFDSNEAKERSSELHSLIPYMLWATLTVIFIVRPIVNLFCRERRARTACTYEQSDLALHCPLFYH